MIRCLVDVEGWFSAGVGVRLGRGGYGRIWIEEDGRLYFLVALSSAETALSCRLGKRETEL